MWGFNGTARISIEYSHQARYKGLPLTRWTKRKTATVLSMLRRRTDGSRITQCKTHPPITELSQHFSNVQVSADDTRASLRLSSCSQEAALTGACPCSSNRCPALTNVFFLMVALACGENARAAEIADNLGRFIVLNNRKTPGERRRIRSSTRRASRCWRAGQIRTHLTNAKRFRGTSLDSSVSVLSLRERRSRSAR